MLIIKLYKYFFMGFIITSMVLLADCRDISYGAKPSGPNLFHGTLRPHPENPRYFTDGKGRAIYLTGSHVWDSLQDWGGPTPDFDYDAYLNLLKANNHNFIRLWRIGECTIKGTNPRTLITPMPWKRTGPGLANDGEPKFDLTRFDDEYFSRIRSRVKEAGNRGIYVSIMLFDGIYDWKTHPFNKENNVNGIDGDTFKDGTGRGVHALDLPDITRLNERYIRKVIDTVNDQDNVLYEVGNEIKRHSVEWQYHVINYIHAYEKKKLKKHPVGMTSTGGNGVDDVTNKDLFNSPADWISPRSSEPGQNYSYNPPPATGKKVIISDTDHLWGILSDPTPQWVWKSFLRGMNPILMDVLQNSAPGRTEKWNDPGRPGLAETRLAMGQTLKYASRMNLSKMMPFVELASTGYCLADRGVEYLVYFPFDDLRSREQYLHKLGIFDIKISVDLYAVPGTFRIERVNTMTNEITDGGIVEGGSNQYFKIPFTGDAVLYLYRDKM